MNTGESQTVGGRQLAVNRPEKEADQNLNEDGNHESLDVDQRSGIEEEQTSSDAEEESEDSE